MLFYKKRYIMELKAIDSPYKPVLKKIIEYSGETADSFTIRLDWGIKHEPGQFVFLSLPGIGEAPISICSYSEKYVELNIKAVGNVTRALEKLKKGSKVFVRGPYGKPYPMEYFKGNNIIIIGGGCGVAPLKGLIEFIEKDRENFKEVKIFFGFRTPEDRIFKSKLKHWKEEFHMYITFDQAQDKVCHDGTRGYVTDKLKVELKDNKNKVVFVCGPPIMILKTAEILKDKGFHDDQIFLSAERLMYCGMGKCGRCMIHGRYTCLDGAVFRYDEIKNYQDD